MTAAPPTGFLVARKDDGFGEAYPLHPGTRYGVGRAPTNRIIIRDDLCSREHAEVYHGGAWTVRDNGSLNGSHVNEARVHGEAELADGDDVRFGRSRFVFVSSLARLPSAPAKPDPEEQLAIRSRLSSSKYLPEPPTGEFTLPVIERLSPAAALGLLYKLGLDMAAAATPTDLAETVAGALLGATPADVAAVLARKDGRDWLPMAYRTRNANRSTYHKVSQFVGAEVLASKQAILAENVAADKHLKNRDSLNELRVRSLICAPILGDGQVIGLLHLYCTLSAAQLGPDDLELTLAAARQFGAAWVRLKREAVLSAEVASLQGKLPPADGLVGESPVMAALEAQIRRVAATKATVLIRGESGVGKELVARGVHRASPRADEAFVCLNCAALTETLLESELFGHEKGAFTGATERTPGKFEAADRGTIFLDEIGEMALTTQAKFLRVLEGHPFERVGGHTPIRADVRVVAATNRPLEEAVRDGSFRKDLFFRLQVVQLDVPPLRARPDDVPRLAEHFLRHFCKETGRKLKGFTPAAAAKLKAYHWPGNVRELRNTVERAVALCPGPAVEESDVWLSMLDGPPAVAAAEYEPISLAEVEKRHILATLTHTGGNKSRAAEVLGVERSTLDRKLKGYDGKK